MCDILQRNVSAGEKGLIFYQQLSGPGRTSGTEPAAGSGHQAWERGGDTPSKQARLPVMKCDRVPTGGRPWGEDQGELVVREGFA